MPLDDHERARLLIDQRLVEGIAEEEQNWLTSHLSACPECAEHVGDTARMLAGLTSLSFEAAAIRRVHRRRILLIAACLGVLAAVPVYRSVRDAERERQDALLMENVAAKISQTVPEALEPLRTPVEETK